jgi:hypothetical protein
LDLTYPPRNVEGDDTSRARALWDEDILHLDVLAAGADHAHRVPGVDDAVVALRLEAKAPVDRRLLVLAVDRHGEHVPVGVVDPRRERPVPVHDVAALDRLAAPGRERDRGGDEHDGGYNAV